MAGDTVHISDRNMLSVAKAYSAYTTTQAHKNFHGIIFLVFSAFCDTNSVGLRDYYSLIKCLARGSSADEVKALCYALERNFGGLTDETERVSFHTLFCE